VALVAHVYPSGVAMHDGQTRISRRYPPLQLSPLFPVQTSTFQPLKSGHFALCHVILLKSEFRPGLGLRRLHTLQRGRTGPFSRHRRATNQCIATAEVMLLNGHKAPNDSSTIACRPGLITIKRDSGADLKFLVQCIAFGGIGVAVNPNCMPR